MSFHKKALVLFLAFTLLFTTFTACGAEKASNRDDTTIASTTASDETHDAEERLSLGIPEAIDYQGGTFVINTYDYTGTATGALYCPFAITEEIGESVNDITYRSVKKVRELLNLDLTYTYHNSNTDSSYLRKLAVGGDTTVDAVKIIDRFGVGLVDGNYVVSYENISTIDLSNPWWFEEINRDISIGEKLCFAMGAMNADATVGIITLAFNKQMLEDNNLDNPYDLVRSGTWTIDNFYSLMKPVINDLDGNGKWNEYDRYGVCYTHDDYYNVFAAISGENIVMKDSDDQPYCAVLGNERLISIWQKIKDYKMNGRYGYDVCHAGQTGFALSNTNTYTEPIMMFKAGHALFTSVPGLTNYSLLRDMDDNFGILPFPTYDEKEAGEAYSSYSNGIGCPFFVPNSGLDTDRVGYVFEALCYYYYYDIIPEYLETVAFTKQIRDDDSLEMLQMMSENHIIDLASGYWWESTYAPFYNIFCNNVGDFVSTYQKQEAAINNAIEKLSTAFAESYGN